MEDQTDAIKETNNNNTSNNNNNNNNTTPPISNGIASSPTAKHNDHGTKSVSVDNGLGDGSSTGDTSNSSSGQQQQKITTNGTANGAIQCQRKTSTNQINSARQKKAAAGVELKSKIIEFMRDKPYLWNRWHPGYNDNKRRENEFSLFSQQIDYPVPEIKRVWHVLRTNFFRAHKYQSERAPNVGGAADKGDRCWKYYQSMKFILESTHNNNDEISNNTSKSNVSINDDSSSSVKDIRQTRSSKILKDARGCRRIVQRTTNQPINSAGSDSSNNSSHVPSALTIATTTPAITSTSTPTISASDNNHNITFSSGTRSNHGRSLRAHRDDNNHDTSIITNIGPDQFSLAHGRASSLSAFNEMSKISFDANDDDDLYARSLTANLKKFYPTTKEAIKLKIRDLIVEYTRKQQQPLPMQRMAMKAVVQPKQAYEEFLVYVLNNTE
uniref:MADF domain-containing protein n=1 Tax=Aceria tosichella TaxID=561515 RepID=A0A6G1SBB6_9ACAR